MTIHQDTLEDKYDTISVQKVQTDDGLKAPVFLGDATACVEVTNYFLDDLCSQRASTSTTFFWVAVANIHFLTLGFHSHSTDIPVQTNKFGSDGNSMADNYIASETKGIGWS